MFGDDAPTTATTAPAAAANDDDADDDDDQRKIVNEERAAARCLNDQDQLEHHPTPRMVGTDDAERGQQLRVIVHLAAVLPRAWWVVLRSRCRCFFLTYYAHQSAAPFNALFGPPPVRLTRLPDPAWHGPR